MSDGIGEVVRLVDRVPPRQEKENYNGVEITYRFSPATKQWTWRFGIPTVTQYTDTAVSLEKAKKAAHKLLDQAKGED